MYLEVIVMKDFDGKVIKVYLNSNSGLLCETGDYIRSEDDFLIIRNTMTGQIHYLCKYFIKYVEIVRDIAGDYNE